VNRKATLEVTDRMTRGEINEGKKENKTRPRLYNKKGGVFYSIKINATAFKIVLIDKGED
jgi:hypothetical protein